MNGNKSFHATQHSARLVYPPPRTSLKDSVYGSEGSTNEFKITSELQ
jgi:hypothetical protein